VQIKSIKQITKNRRTPGVLKLKYMVVFWDENHYDYEHSAFFTIETHHNTGNNTLEYNYNIHIIRLFNSTDMTYISPTKIIDLSTTETEEDLLKMLVYSSDEYLEHLVNTKLNLDSEVNKVVNLISDILDKSREDKNFSYKKYLGINPLNIQMNSAYDITSHENVYSVPVYVMNGYHPIQMQLTIVFPDNRSESIKYKYEIYNTRTRERTKCYKFREIKLSELEMQFNRKTLCMRLINIYHIVDKTFKTEMAKE
jgi:hypothetical protein